MKFYLAPMEGVTGYVYRNAYEKCFHNVDRFFTPFISPNQSKGLSSKERRDVLPENNTVQPIPQILTANSADFIRIAKILREFGYFQVNLNLGCPSATVTTKGKGAGFLAYPEKLESFLSEIFEADIIKISIKTRIGFDDPDEFAHLLELYNRYPIQELIVHPRIRQDFYENKPNLSVFEQAIQGSRAPVCYNGDLCNREDYRKITERFEKLDSVMIGRGVIRNPGLIGEILGQEPLCKEDLLAFHEEVYEGYRNSQLENNGVLFRMKELWSYQIEQFEDNRKYAKQIKKATTLRDYEAAVRSMFADCKMN